MSFHLERTPEAPGNGVEDLRVLMISDVYFPRINGVSTSIQTFRESLAPLGAKVDLLVPEYPVPSLEPDHGLYRLNSFPLFFDAEDRMMSLRLPRALLSQLDSGRYDVIHVHTPFVAQILGQRLSRRLHCPMVVTHHTHFEEYLSHYLPWVPGKWLRSLAQSLARWQARRADAIVVPTESIRVMLQSYGIGQSLEVIGTGLPEDRYCRGDGLRFREAHGIDPKCPMLLFVGRVAHEKNIDFLLFALQVVRRSFPEVILVVAGEGPARAHLERLVSRLDLSNQVRFVGYLDRRGSLQDCYAAGDVFVFASRTETQGLVLLEAMAAGTPVVALAELGTRDILEPGRGSLIAPDDPQEFAASVCRLLGDMALRASLASEALNYAHTWSAEGRSAALLALYQSVTARAK